MFSKSIFKQSVRSNGPLWLVITIVLSLLITIFIVSFDADDIGQIVSAAEDTSFGDQVSDLGTLMGTLEMFFKMVAILLGLIYGVFCANNLVVSEIDSGSMAYTLSTPIKRGTVIFTKMVYMIGSIILMFAITAGVGMGVTEIVHNNLSGNAITEDVEEAAASLDRDPSYVRDNLYMIEDDDYALQAGADARGMDNTAYEKYLDEAMKRDSLDKASDEITDSRRDEYDDDDDMDRDDIEITTDELADDPGMILDDSDALEEGGKPLGMNVNEYRDYVNDLVDEHENEEENDDEQTNPSAVLTTAKEVTENELDVSSATVDDNMNLMKNDSALQAASEATDVPEDQLSEMIDESMVSSAIDSDEGTEFDLETFGWLILGSCLLTLAMGSISFFASTLFNRTNTAMALGGGLPLAFYIISIVIEQNDNLEDLKYITITTLYNTGEIIADGDFLIQMGVLAVIPIVLYTISGFIFTRKDLPL
ncbi:ABC transporter permease subunit [Tetragenococcus halophilus]|uniref:ABC transporter permease subunit n=1 Tax=Tetragenococcus halophilus TaxID=51669 RepID=UPI001B5FC496|nr:ABC transporter permease subunit [Tetragenococcus halophilus]GFK21352.1 hypothetical protein WJ7_08150 [Tetragenococcus halophilus]